MEIEMTTRTSAHTAGARLFIGRDWLVPVALAALLTTIGIWWGWTEIWNPDPMTFKDLFLKGELPFSLLMEGASGPVDLKLLAGYPDKTVKTVVSARLITPEPWPSIRRDGPAVPHGCRVRRSCPPPSPR